jgi:hypothetical protein
VKTRCTIMSTTSKLAERITELWASNVSVSRPHTEVWDLLFLGHMEAMTRSDGSTRT